MIRKKYSILLLVLAVLTGCRGGGTVGGLLPAPRFLKGSIETGVYSAPNNAFCVQIPHPPGRSHEDRYEWTYTKVDEGIDQNLTYVIFGPAAFDLNRYHVVVVRNRKETGMSFRERAEKTLDFYVKREEKSKNVKFERETILETEIDGELAIYAVYQYSKNFIVFTYFDRGKHFAFVMAEVHSNSGIASVKPSVDIIKSRSWSLYNDMVNSLEIP